MNFRSLILPDCGQNNPISELVGHVTDDKKFQESIGDPHAAALNQSNLNQPQSFRMNDLMKEINQLEPQRFPIPSSSHIDVPNYSSFDAMFTTEYQNQMQEFSQLKIEQAWNQNNLNSYGNETNSYYSQGFTSVLSSPYGLPEPQNFDQHRPTCHFERKSPNPGKSLMDLEDGIIISNLNELKNSNQFEEFSTNPQNTQDEQPELLSEAANYKIERKSIPKFSNPKQFMSVMNTSLAEFRKKELNLDSDQNLYNIARENLINPMVYSHIEDNPMKKRINAYKKGKEALANSCYYEAALYFDEAVRRKRVTRNGWFHLSYALYRTDQDDKAMSALEQYLRVKPHCFQGIHIKWALYNKYNCKYQACQTVLNWMKNNKLYSHFVPPDFTMDDKDTGDLDEDLLESVKNILLRAVRENPETVSKNLQIMIGNLYSISKDYDKVADCKLAAIKFSDKASVADLYNMGFSLFYNDKPHEALDALLEAADLDDCTKSTYQAIAYFYTYLQNYRQAIHYYKQALGPESLGDDPKFQLEGDTLEDEFELCLRLYCEFRSR